MGPSFQRFIRHPSQAERQQRGLRGSSRSDCAQVPVSPDTIALRCLGRRGSRYSVTGVNGSVADTGRLLITPSAERRGATSAFPAATPHPPASPPPFVNHFNESQSYLGNDKAKLHLEHCKLRNIYSVKLRSVIAPPSPLPPRPPAPRHRGHNKGQQSQHAIFLETGKHSLAMKTSKARGS